MNDLKPSHWVAIAAGSCVLLYLTYTHLQNFGDPSFLSSLVALEIGIFAIWNYEQRFFTVLLFAFLCAGLRIPLQAAGATGRWAALGAGAAIGFVLWIQGPRKPFRTVHMFAFFCVCTAFVSATVSTFSQVSYLKALSLALLFLYCASGARLSAIGREQRFFNGMMLGCEITVLGTAVCYFGLHDPVWGNPNSLGAAMSIGVFPILLWGWLIADSSAAARNRKLIALLVCAYLIHISLSRAAMVTEAGVAVILCICLRRYRLLVRMTALVLALVSVQAMLSPDSISKQAGDFKDHLLYKGHKEEGLMGSRNQPWKDSIASIKQHPWFGTGYGTSPIIDDPRFSSGNVNSTAEVNREHGSSYIAIAEWVGLAGVVPFIVLLALMIAEMCKVFLLMYRTGNVRYYSIPLALVVFAGFIHAGFEDWLFAVGSYLCLFFWVCAFLLADLAPEGEILPAPSSSRLAPRSLPADFGAVTSR